MYRFEGSEGALVRKLAPSISVDFSKSEKQTTLHVVIHKAQVTNLNF